MSHADSGDVWGKPDVPPPVNLEHYKLLTRLAVWVESHGSSPKGHYKIVLCAPHNELYKALLLAEAKGMLLHLEVYAPDIESADVDKELMMMLNDMGVDVSERDTELMEALDMTNLEALLEGGDDVDGAGT